MADVIDALLAGDAEQAVALLDPDATFASPVAEYRGRERVAAVWVALVQVLGRDARVTARFGDAGDQVAFFAASFAGRAGQGVLRVSGSPPREVTLMVRPLSTLMPAIERMRELLGS